jgi:hypothetical protein
MSLKRHTRRRVSSRLTANKDAIVRSMVNEPADFDGREKLWMERDRLHRQLEDLT